MGLTTPNSLTILVWNFYQTFVIVFMDFWLRFESQIHPQRLAINFLFITARADRTVRLVGNSLIFFVGEYSSVRPEICRLSSKIQWRFLCGILGKNYFGGIFQKFCANQGYTLLQFCANRNLWNSALLPAILFLVFIRLKKFTQVLSYVICT